MGQKISVPERIHRAAKLNDVAELQALCQDMRLNGALDAETRRNMLDWKDEEGRTGLMWACQRNFLQAAQILLGEGADIHAIAPKRREGGSALAEAIAFKHEAMVDLLLRHGADPFTENPGGKTPMDLALETRAVNILRACERQALFAGYVNTKVMQLKGLSTASKDRWVVIAPRFTPPPPGSSVGEVRVMMLMYRNAAEAEARTKVWLDGAALYMSAGEAVLRLHPNHVQPRNIYCRFEAGWMMFFKPAQSAGVIPVGGRIPPGNPEATFSAFLATSSRPLEQLQQQQQLRVATADTNPWTHGGAAAAPAAASIPPTSGGGGWGSSGGPYAGHTGGYPQQQQPYYHVGQQMQPAAAPPVGSMQSQTTSQQQQQQGNVANDALAAAPGETDEQFARRLAAMFGSSPPQSVSAAAGGISGSSSIAPSTVHSSAAPSRVASTTAAPPPAADQQQQHFDFRNPFASGGLPPEASDNPFRAHGDGSDLQQQPAAAAATTTTAAAAAADTDASAPSAPPAAPPSAAAATAAAAPALLSSAAIDATAGAGSDADLCVICLSAAREVGLLHGSSVHKCLCKECAGLVSVGTPCPMCRQKIERILGVY